MTDGGFISLEAFLVFFIGFRMKVQIGFDERTEVRFQRKHAACKVQRHTVQKGYLQSIQIRGNIFHQQQRGQKMPTELPVSSPRGTVFIYIER